MIEISDLPHVIAALNAATIVSLSVGLVMIRRGDRDRHRAAMLAALGFSLGFLVAYLVFKANAGLMHFAGEGVVRTVYFAILTVHILAAVAITPLVPVVVVRALSGRFDAHKRLARWTWPAWMFVAVSGIVVYAMAQVF